MDNEWNPPLIEDVIDDIVTIMVHLYNILKPTRSHVIKSLNREVLGKHIIDIFKKSFATSPEHSVCQISLYRLSYQGLFETPLDLELILDDTERYLKNKYDYYNNISTIIYNNDKFEFGLEIYIVPFDSVGFTIYEICMMIEAISDLSF